MRRFAKQQALVRRWPELTKTIYEGGGRVIRELELLATGNITTPAPEIQKIWDHYRDDEALKQLLTLRPLFSTSTEGLSHRAYQEALAATHPTLSSPESSALPDAKPEPQPIVGPTAAEPSIMQLPITVFREDGYSRIRVGDGDPGVVSKLDLDLDRIQKRLQSLRHTAGSAASPSDYLNRVRQLGSLVYDGAFRDTTREALLQALDVSKPVAVQINLDIQVPELTQIPWECLYVPERADFWSLIPNVSVNRLISLGTTDTMPIKPIFPPVQIYAFFSTESAAQTTERSPIEYLSRVLQQNNLFEFRSMSGFNVSNAESDTRDFYPVVLHGSGVTGPPSIDYSFEWLTPQIADLVSRSIRVIVLQYDLASKSAEVARHLLLAGAQCVILTAGTVNSDVAQLFTREFYQALATGQNVERAMVEARRGLHAQGKDWTPYELFTSLPNIDALRIEIPATKQMA